MLSPLAAFNSGGIRVGSLSLGSAWSCLMSNQLCQNLCSNTTPVSRVSKCGVIGPKQYVILCRHPLFGCLRSELFVRRCSRLISLGDTIIRYTKRISFTAHNSSCSLNSNIPVSSIAIKKTLHHSSNKSIKKMWGLSSLFVHSIS